MIITSVKFGNPYDSEKKNMNIKHSTASMWKIYKALKVKVDNDNSIFLKKHFKCFDIIDFSSIDCWKSCIYLHIATPHRLIVNLYHGNFMK